jgi:DNA polymerase I
MILIIDLFNLAHRASHAYSELWSPDKEVFTGLFYGTFNMLAKYASDFRPDHIWLVSDPIDPTHKRSWRSDVFPDYKRRDKKRSEEDQKKVSAIHRQLPTLKQALLCTNVLWLEQPHLEADDIIGCLWDRYRETGTEFVLVSTDKDMLTLLRPGFSLHYPGQRRTIFLSHQNFPDLAGEFISGNSSKPAEKRIRFKDTREWAAFRWLTGDASDMIPGLPSCGPSGARKILDEGGYNNFCSMVSQKQAAGKKVGKKERAWVSEEAQAIYKRNQLLMRINPPPAEYVNFEMTEHCAQGVANFEGLAQWMQGLQFSTKDGELLDRLRGSALCRPKRHPNDPLQTW